jgi:hypothetical protein
MSVKVEKSAFDAALRSLLKAPPTPSKKISAKIKRDAAKTKQRP